jgi:6-pyruvoyltetrahydropterin/6-carboxytetrahydropterin synthase
MFEITVRKDFRATHAVRNLQQGQIETPHEHVWRCEVTIAAPKLDESGCVIDFAEVDVALGMVLTGISDRNINETALFSDLNPSTENIAKYIHRSLSSMIGNETRRIARVNLWENSNHSATYFE